MEGSNGRSSRRPSRTVKTKPPRASVATPNGSPSLAAVAKPPSAVAPDAPHMPATIESWPAALSALTQCALWSAIRMPPVPVRARPLGAPRSTPVAGPAPPDRDEDPHTPATVTAVELRTRWTQDPSETKKPPVRSDATPPHTPASPLGDVDARTPVNATRRTPFV